jgi:hypothetical protein
MVVGALKGSRMKEMYEEGKEMRCPDAWKW